MSCSKIETVGLFTAPSYPAVDFLQFSGIIFDTPVSFKNGYIAPIAQVVEHLPFKQRVAGSSPAGRTLQDVEKICHLAIFE